MNFSTVVLAVFTCFIFGNIVFLYGFFPISHSQEERSGFSDIPNQIEDVVLNTTRYQARISYTIIMIVDALRYDFLSSDNMEYTFNEIKSKQGCLYKIKVDSPTVTMPRIKSLTTGSISNFIDVVLNLGHPEGVSDSVIHQLYDRGDRIVLYGDNTWTKLFPGMYHRKRENFDSFFVNDFYEGDKNITKRLAAELKYPDWNFLILHYLGLDHIGHVESSFSPKIPNKLREMDRVAQQIHIAMDMLKRSSKLPPLFMLTADHGMRNSGGHGGSSIEEIFVPFITFGTPCGNSSIPQYNQIDIASTLAVLLGCPIPATSIGKIISEAIDFLDSQDILFALYYNTSHLIRKLIGRIGIGSVKEKSFFQQYNRAMRSHVMYLKSIDESNRGNKAFFKQAKNDYEQSSHFISELLIESFVHFDMFAIVMGVLLTTLSMLLIFLLTQFDVLIEIRNICKLWRTLTIIVLSAIIMIFCCKCTQTDSELCNCRWYNYLFFVITSVVSYATYRLIKTFKIRVPKDMHGFQHLLIFGTIFHAFSFISSSFIEEEHQTWYYFTITFFILTLCSELRKVKINDQDFKKIESLSVAKILHLNTKTDHCMIHKNKFDTKATNSLKKIRSISRIFFEWSQIFCMHIFIRRLNQTGDKWLSLPDIGDWFVAEDNKLWLSFFLLASLLLMVYTIVGYGGLLTNVLSFTAVLLIYYYRTISGSVLLFDIKQTKSKTCLLVFCLNIAEIFAINYIPVVYRFVLNRGLSSSAFKHCLATNITLMTLIFALIRKPHNVILLPAIMITLHKVFGSITNICRGRLRVFCKVIVAYWVGKMFFFYDGNSNNLASIDLNAGYIGLDSYNPIIVSMLVALNTYSGPILSYAILLHSLINNDETQKKQSLRFGIGLLTLLIVFPLGIYLLVLINARTHLFIWTVFSPKILYEFFNAIVYYILIFFTNSLMGMVQVL